MVFSSLTFLFGFLPVALLLYYLVPRAWKNGVLFLCSLFFYAWGEPVYVLLMLFSTICDYCCGWLVERYRGTRLQKLGLIISLVANLGLLGFFKYADMLITTANAIAGTAVPLLNLALPIGISFYTFQTMSYTIDVYRGEAKLQKNIIDFGAYVTLFPQLIAGPIVRYRDVAEQLRSRKCSTDKFGNGVKRFVVGLAKKVLLANQIGALWSDISGRTQVTVLGAWLGIVACGFQVYFDFSGYSDMAIGLGEMLGFDFGENFNYPFIAKSATEFWRRWHISLGSWFRDYVYIPLGGNRKGLPRQLRNILIVWFLTGLWHGASWNFVLWGLYFGFLLLIEKLFLQKWLNRLPAVFGHIYLLLAVSISWVWFEFAHLGEGWQFLRTMFGLGNTALTDQRTMYQLLNYLPLLAICGLAATPLGKNLMGRLNRYEKGKYALELVGTAGLFLLSVAFLIGSSYNPFLYFRF